MAPKCKAPKRTVPGTYEFWGKKRTLGNGLNTWYCLRRSWVSKWQNEGKCPQRDGGKRRDKMSRRSNSVPQRLSLPIQNIHKISSPSASQSTLCYILPVLEWALLCLLTPNQGKYSRRLVCEGHSEPLASCLWSHSCCPTRWSSVSATTWQKA